MKKIKFIKGAVLAHVFIAILICNSCTKEEVRYVEKYQSVIDKMQGEWSMTFDDYDNGYLRFTVKDKNIAIKINTEAPVLFENEGVFPYHILTDSLLYIEYVVNNQTAYSPYIYTISDSVLNLSYNSMTTGLTIREYSFYKNKK